MQALLCQRRRKNSDVSIIVIAQTRSYTYTHMHQQAILIKKIKDYQQNWVLISYFKTIILNLFCTDNTSENSVLG